MRSFERDVVRVPLGWLVNLLGWRDGPVNAAGQFRIFGTRIVTVVRHLKLHPVECRVAKERRAQSTTAVALLAELEFELQLKVTVFLFAQEPASARFAAVQNSV